MNSVNRSCKMSQKKETSGNRSINWMIGLFSACSQNSQVWSCSHANQGSKLNPTPFSQSMPRLLKLKTTQALFCPSLKALHQASLTKLDKKKKKNSKRRSVSFLLRSLKTLECPSKYSIATPAYSENQGHPYTTEFCKRQGSTLSAKTAKQTGSHSCS